MTLSFFPYDVEGYLSETDGLALLVLACAAPEGDIVELGTYKGRSAICLAQSGRMITCVDHFKGEQFEDLKEGAIPHSDHTEGDYFADLMENLNAAGGKYEIVSCDTVGAGYAYAGPGVALLFIDGAHDYDSVKADWEAWSDHLTPDGTVALHDKDFDGPKRLIEELRADGWVCRNVPDTSIAVVRRAHA